MTDGSPQIEGLTGGDGAPADRRRYAIQLTVAIAFGLMFAFLLLGFVIELTSPHVAAGSRTRGLEIGAAVVSVFLLVLFVEWAIHAEHHLRRVRGNPVATALQATTAVRPTRRWRSRGRYGPGVTTLILGVMTIAGVAMVPISLAKRSDALRTSYTQSHGDRVDGSVTYVHNSSNCGRYSCTYSSDIGVVLTPPVDGTLSTVVHYPDTSFLVNGEQVQILVDPKEPSYAELPGYPRVRTADWVLGLVVAGVLLVLAAGYARRVRTLLRQRRTYTARVREAD